jgi:hypothetical protein
LQTTKKAAAVLPVDTERLEEPGGFGNDERQRRKASGEMGKRERRGRRE